MKKSVVIVAILTSMALAGTAALAVLGEGDARDHGAGFHGHVHGMVQHLHQAMQHHDAMAEMIERLELTPEQHQHLEKIHEILANHHRDAPRGMLGLHEELVALVEQGAVENGAVRGVIDGHLEEIRKMAYAVGDEMTALVNSLDSRQRELLLEHLQEVAAHHSEEGHGAP